MANQRRFWKKAGAGRHESSAGIVEFRFRTRKVPQAYWFIEKGTNRQFGPFHDFIAATAFAENRYDEKAARSYRMKPRKKGGDEKEELDRHFGG